MTLSPSPSTNSSADLRSSLDIVELKPGLRFSRAVLTEILPDVETALFFGKVFELDYAQLSKLLSLVLKSDLAKELFGNAHAHSTDLQGYLVDDIWCNGVPPGVTKGKTTFKPDVPKGEILPEVWKSLEIEVAASIKTVAEKIQSVIGLMPGKQGSMVFNTMAKLNKHRPTIGRHEAGIHHAPVKENLFILDVSSSVSRRTVETIVDDVVAASYMANAHMAVVSNTTTHWEPGSYSVADVLAHSEFGGTHYETLGDLLNRDWGVVVCVADYDSSASAKAFIDNNCMGHIDEALDISLVNRPTFLIECVGLRAAKVRPLLIANTPRVLGSDSSAGW